MDVQAGAAGAPSIGVRAVRKVFWRIVPFRSIGDLGGFAGPSFIGKGTAGGAAGDFISLAVPPFVSFAMLAPMRLASGLDPATTKAGTAAGTAA